MASTTERLAVLKTVSIFSATSDDLLTTVANLLTECIVQTGEKIIEKGELGDCMYIIVEGRVRVHDGDHTLNYLEQRAVFGEMSVLDPAPRSISITAVQDTTLFRLDREAFYCSIGNRIEIVYGIIHILCEQLRLRIYDMAEDYKYMEQFARVTSAAIAIEAGHYEPESLDEVAQRTDTLGQLARVFQHMAYEVYAREQRLQQQVQELRIELSEAKQHRQVAETTETEYFHGLLARADALRSIMEGARE